MPTSGDSGQSLPANTHSSQPDDGSRKIQASECSDVADASPMPSRPENPPCVLSRTSRSSGSQTLILADEPLQTETHRRLDVIPPVALKFDSDVDLFYAQDLHEDHIVGVSPLSGLHRRGHVSGLDAYRLLDDSSPPVLKPFLRKQAGREKRDHVHRHCPGGRDHGQLARAKVTGSSLFRATSEWNSASLAVASRSPDSLSPPDITASEADTTSSWRRVARTSVSVRLARAIRGDSTSNEVGLQRHPIDRW